MRDALGNVQSVLVIGGGSDIALVTVRRLVEGRARTVVLAADHPEALVDATDALRAAGATTVEVVRFDAVATEAHTPMIENLFDRFGDFDVVLIAFAVLGDQAVAEHDADAALEIVRVNHLGTISVAVPVAQRMKAQGHGTIVALSSVRDDRVPRTSFVYRSSTAGTDAFLQRLGDSLVGTGVKVMLVRPGFVAPQETAGMSPARVSTTADAVADAIVSGLARGSTTVWVPGALRYAMSALRHVPRPIFGKLPL